MTLLKSIIPRKGSFVANVLTLMSSTALAQLAVIITTPILTRLYSPEDFGTFAIYVSIISLLAAIASWRYEFAIPLVEDKSTAINLIALCFGILLIMTILVAIALWLMGDQVLQQFNAPMLRPFLWIIPFSFLGAGIYQVLNYWAIRRKAFGALARIKISQSLGQTITSIGMGTLSFKVIGLLCGDFIGRAAGSCGLGMQAWRHEREVFDKVSIPGMLAVARRYWRFPTFSAGSTFLNMSAIQLPTILLSAYYNMEVVGWFSLGQMLIAGPMSLVSSAGSQVFLGEAARLVREDPRALRRLFLKSTMTLLVLSFPLGLLAWFSPWFVPLIFGKTWQQAGLYTQSLTLMFILQFIVSPISNLAIYELQHWQFLWDVSRLVLTFGCFVFAQKTSLLPTTCIFIYGLVMSFNYILLFWLNMRGLQLRIKGK